MDIITKVKILDKCLSRVKEMANSQQIKIDDDYYLLDKDNPPIKPTFEFVKLNKDIIIFKINYERLGADISFEMTVLELDLI